MTETEPLRVTGTGLVVEFANRHGERVRALDDVDFSFAAGEIVAVVGESGSGKTTLARTLLGLQSAISGSVTVGGDALGGSRRQLKDLRRRVQMVLQDPSGSLNPRHTVYESVAEGIRVHRLARETGRSESELVAEALAASGLRPPESFFLRYPHELSGGQRQRVLIAGALAIRPQLLIADEPVSSLDASIRGEILALLLDLRREFGLGVMVVTHDLGLAWNIADRIVVMYLGRVVESGTTEEVLANPTHPYTRALLSVVPEVEGLAPVVLTGEIPDPTRIPSGCRFHPRCPALQAGLPEPTAQACRSHTLPIVTAEQSTHQAACWIGELS